MQDSADALEVRGGAAAKAGGFDLGLIIYFGLWYLGNYYVSLSVFGPVFIWFLALESRIFFLSKKTSRLPPPICLLIDSFFLNLVQHYQQVGS